MFSVKMEYKEIVSHKPTVARHYCLPWGDFLPSNLLF